MSAPRFILKRDRDESDNKIVPDDTINKLKEKVVTPPTEKELQELKQEYVVQCTKLKKVEKELKLVGSPNKERFDAITAKLQEVYDEWSAEACGQQTTREKIVSDFQDFVQRIKGCENVTVEVFGSTHTGFALKDSDINMNLRISDNSSSTYDTVINGVLKHLTTDSNDDNVVYTDLRNNLYSSVSHIMFMHRPSGLSCHVRYGSYHKMPIYTSKLLQRYGAVDHRLKVLAVVLKYWAKLCQLDIQELGSYPSQMFVLMLINFLQHRTPPLLPVPPKPNNFDDTQQCLEHFDKYLSGLDHMIKTWTVSNTESLGMLWLGMLRYYSVEANLEKEVVQVTQNDILLRETTSWSHYKQLVVLSPVNPCCNIARASSSHKMYLYFEACIKATLIYFGKAVLNKPSTWPIKSYGKQQDLTSHDPPATSHDPPLASHDPCVTKRNGFAMTKFPKNVTYLSDVASQLSNFSDGLVKQSKENEPIKSQLEDHDDILSISKMEILCEHNDTHLEDGVVAQEIEGLEAAKGVQYEFSSSNFTKKELPDVCSLCRKEGHTFTSPNCPSSKKVERSILATHPPLALKQLKELDRVFVTLKENICLKPMDKILRRDICNIIEHHVKIIYPDVEMVLFGSSANEFGKARSDVDINMKLPGSFEHDDNVKVIENVADYLKQQDWLMSTIEVVTTARVPLVKMKLTERWNSLECDISLGNSLALHNTQLLAHYAKIDKRVQVMGYVLKEFAKSADMCDASSGSLSSYAYIILLLHYLQQVKPPVVPVLQQIGEGGHVDVDGWNCWFHRFDDLSQLEKIWPHVGENKKTIGELFINFLRFYLEEFDWLRHVVCIRQLEPLSKLDKEWAPKRVCIEDPFNHDHNLSSHLSSKMWSYICDAFKCAHDHFTNPLLYTQPLTIATVLSVGFDKNVPKDGLCYTCGKRGHKFYNCPNGRHNNTCDLCGKQGHIKSQCPLAIGYHPRYPVQLPPRPPTAHFLLRPPYMPNMYNHYPVSTGLPRAGINLIPAHHIMPISPMQFRGSHVHVQPHGRLPMNAVPYGSRFGRPIVTQMQPSSKQTGTISQPNNWPRFM